MFCLAPRGQHERPGERRGELGMEVKREHDDNRRTLIICAKEDNWTCEWRLTSRIIYTLFRCVWASRVRLVTSGLHHLLWRGHSAVTWHDTNKCYLWNSLILIVHVQEKKYIRNNQHGSLMLIRVRSSSVIDWRLLLCIVGAKKSNIGQR